MDLLPNFQILSDLLEKITDRVNPLPNHKLFRIDNIYFYPHVKDQIYLKSVEIYSNITLNQNNDFDKIMSLSYYHGIFLRAPKQIFYGLKCYL